MADCARLESAYTERYREFESRPLRQIHDDRHSASRLRRDIPKGIASSKA